MNTTTAIVFAVCGTGLLSIVLLLVVLAARSLSETAKKNEAWPEFARSIGGRWFPGTAGRVDRIEAQFRGWPAYVDTCLTSMDKRLVNYTRMRVFYRSFVPFELHLNDSVRIDETGLAAGQLNKQVFLCEPGRQVQYVASDNALAVQMLTSELRDMFCHIRQSDIQIRRRRQWHDTGVSSSIYEVVVHRDGVVVDFDELTCLWSALTAVLVRLDELGVAGQLAGNS